MGLSNQQIERYARQIIVPGIGGVAQERLLSARLMLAGEVADVATVLAYMVGAGVGEIRLQLPASEAAEQDPLIMSAAELNPEVLVKPGAENVAGLNLVLAIGGDSETSELMLRLHHTGVPVIFVRLDEPSIAILPDTPPCLLCADAHLLAPFKRPSDTAGFVAMIAATEAFKLLARVAPAPAPTLLQFNGFACATRRLRQTPLRAKCACSVATEAR
jgi:molybdopterin/thiamine biosynthesis adenylyltransferase